MIDVANIAVWAITPKGAQLAEAIACKMPQTDIFVTLELGSDFERTHGFARLKDAVQRHFLSFSAHIFIMSTGIVVRMIAPLIKNKTQDPAVLVADENGQYVISLLSGHIGGANALTLKVAELIQADPVITTATDVNSLPAVDVLAGEKNLYIENYGAIKTVSMALISGTPIYLHDPHFYLSDDLKAATVLPFPQKKSSGKESLQKDVHAGVYIDDTKIEVPDNTLVLRPASLVAGIGCHRDTSFEELQEFLFNILSRFALAVRSLKCLASVDRRADAAGLLSLAKDLDVPIKFFTSQELNAVQTVENPSAMAKKHIGVESVCEAAAILGSHQGRLIVPKQSTKNITVAVARISFSL